MFYRLPIVLCTQALRRLQSTVLFCNTDTAASFASLRAVSSALPYVHRLLPYVEEDTNACTIVCRGGKKEDGDRDMPKTRRRHTSQ